MAYIFKLHSSVFYNVDSGRLPLFIVKEWNTTSFRPRDRIKYVFESLPSTFSDDRQTLDYWHEILYRIQLFFSLNSSFLWLETLYFVCTTVYNCYYYYNPKSHSGFNPIILGGLITWFIFVFYLSCLSIVS